MGDGEGSDPMSRAPIIITPPGRIPGTPILMSRPRHRQEGGPPCEFTGLPVRLDYPRGFRGLEGVGSERDVRPRPRTTYRTRSPAAARTSIDQLAPWTSRGVSQPWTQHPVGPPC